MNFLIPDDKKLTDNEIVKALECCSMQSYPACKECPYHDNYSKRDCISLRNADIKVLINRQKARIQQLELKVEARNKVLQSKLADIKKLTNKCEDCAGCTSWKCDCANIKLEAYKEFAERLESYLANNRDITAVGYQSVIDDIESLIKELVGDNNES